MFQRVSVYLHSGLIFIEYLFKISIYHTPLNEWGNISHILSPFGDKFCLCQRKQYLHINIQIKITFKHLMIDGFFSVLIIGLYFELMSFCGKFFESVVLGVLLTLQRRGVILVVELNFKPHLAQQRVLIEE